MWKRDETVTPQEGHQDLVAGARPSLVGLRRR